MSPLKLDEVKIQNYKPDNYEQVRKRFTDGIHEAILPTLKSNWNGEKPDTVFCHLAILTFCILSSVAFGPQIGFLTFTVISCVYVYLVYNWYNGYVR